jgi:hypothetical protein
LLACLLAIIAIACMFAFLLACLFIYFCLQSRNVASTISLFLCSHVLQRMYRDEGISFPQIPIASNEAILKDLESNSASVTNLLSTRSWILNDNSVQALYNDFKNNLECVT